MPATQETVVPQDTVAADIAGLSGLLREVAATPTATPAPAGEALGAGSRLGSRYELVRLLGKGGMGAVYLARDLELGREVALKLIAPHLAADPTVLERFKREIQLSSIVTHRNVLRVYDLGESGGVRFLTMQYLEGESLAELLEREGKLPAERAVPLFRQVCEGLAAAHEKGVLHRDLKPQNVMVDARGTAYLTDFGLATSAAASQLTQTGVAMGTPHYMSPEQVKGLHVDERSDIFSLGVMLYAMLTGAMPYGGQTVFDIMMRRTQQPPRPVREIDPGVPAPLDALLQRCLTVEPADRYASVAELLGDLDRGTARPPRRRSSGRARRALALAAAGVALAAAAAAAVLVVPRLRGPQPAPEGAAAAPRSVLVADFANQTGDPIFDGTLEPALGLALEGASFISSHSRAAARKAADALRLEGAALEPARARLVAQRESVQVVISGSIARAGAGYRVAAEAVDAFTGKVLLADAEETPGKEQVLAAATKLAARIRAHLGDATPVELQLKQAEAFSAASVEAAHAFSLGLDLATREARYDEARRHFQEAIRLDPGLGRAYVALANIEQNLGHEEEADRHLKEAMARIDRMSEREKHRSRGTFYLFHRDADRALEAFGALVRQFPGDATGLSSLAVAYELKRDFPRALAEARRSLQIQPRRYIVRQNVGMYSMFVGDLDAAAAEFGKLVEETPRWRKPHAGLAMAHALAGRRDAALAAWERLAGLGPEDASAAAEGLADLAMAEGRLADARALLERGLADDAAAKRDGPRARKLVLRGELHLAAGETARAVAAARRALEGSPPEHVLYAAGRVLADAGEVARAAEVANALERRVAAEPRMYAGLLRGAVELQRGNYPQAVEWFKSAGQRLDGWLVHLDLARAYLAAGAFAQADEELEICARRRGEVSDVYLDVDDTPTWHLYAPVPYHAARASEGLGSPKAAAAYEAFLAGRKAAEDPLTRDARVRLARLRAAQAR